MRSAGWAQLWAGLSAALRPENLQRYRRSFAARAAHWREFLEENPGVAKRVVQKVVDAARARPKAGELHPLQRLGAHAARSLHQLARRNPFPQVIQAGPARNAVKIRQHLRAGQREEFLPVPANRAVRYPPADWALGPDTWLLPHYRSGCGPPLCPSVGFRSQLGVVERAPPAPKLHI